MRGPLNEILDQTGDGGDSCNFTCTYAFFTGLWPNPKLYFGTTINPVRHPTQIPWNNPKNFTIDQAVPWIAVLNKQGVRNYFKWHWLFAPNIERDWPGSKKLPYPHWFYKDSLLYDGRRWPTTFTGKYDSIDESYGKIEKKSFDFADPNQPSFFGMMVIKGKIWPLYPLLPFCYLWCVGSILAHCFVYAKDPTNNDFKQLFIMSTFYKLEKLFMRLHPRGLLEASKLYFYPRGLEEIHDAFVGYLHRKGLYGLATKKKTLLGD